MADGYGHIQPFTEQNSGEIGVRKAESPRKITQKVECTEQKIGKR
jgi:hypothetical protein